MYCSMDSLCPTLEQVCHLCRAIGGHEAELLDMTIQEVDMPVLLFASHRLAVLRFDKDLHR